MLSTLFKNAKYFHLKMIYQHPNGIKNRFKNNADKWVESLGHPHVKTYYHLYQNMQTQQHNIKLTLTEQEESQLSRFKHAHKPKMQMMMQNLTIFHETRPDDYELSRDIKDMTILKFIKQGRQNMNPEHKLVLNAIMFVIAHIIFYFTFFHKKQIRKVQRVNVMNAQLLQSYHFEGEQVHIKKIVQRLKIVNDEYQKQLSLSRQLK